MPCPRVPKPADGQRMKERGRTVLMVGTERVQQPREATQGEAEAAPEAQPVSDDPTGCRDWLREAGPGQHQLTHRDCGGPIRTSRGLPRVHCQHCGAEWWKPGGAPGEWKRI